MNGNFQKNYTSTLTSMMQSVATKMQQEATATAINLVDLDCDVIENVTITQYTAIDLTAVFSASAQVSSEQEVKQAIEQTNKQVYAGVSAGNLDASTNITRTVHQSSSSILTEMSASCTALSQNTSRIQCQAARYLTIDQAAKVMVDCTATAVSRSLASVDFTQIITQSNETKAEFSLFTVIIIAILAGAGVLCVLALAPAIASTAKKASGKDDKEGDKEGGAGSGLSAEAIKEITDQSGKGRKARSKSENRINKQIKAAITGAWVTWAIVFFVGVGLIIGGVVLETTDLLEPAVPPADRTLEQRMEDAIRMYAYVDAESEIAADTTSFQAISDSASTRTGVADVKQAMTIFRDTEEATMCVFSKPTQTLKMWRAVGSVVATPDPAWVADDAKTAQFSDDADESASSVGADGIEDWSMWKIFYVNPRDGTNTPDDETPHADELTGTAQQQADAYAPAEDDGTFKKWLVIGTLTAGSIITAIGGGITFMNALFKSSTEQQEYMKRTAGANTDDVAKGVEGVAKAITAVV